MTFVMIKKYWDRLFLFKQHKFKPKLFMRYLQYWKLLNNFFVDKRNNNIVYGSYSNQIGLKNTLER